MSDVLLKWLHKIKQESIPMVAEEAMMFPKADPFGHGVQVGKYQGLLEAVNVLEELISEQANADRDA